MTLLFYYTFSDLATTKMKNFKKKFSFSDEEWESLMENEPPVQEETKQRIEELGAEKNTAEGGGVKWSIIDIKGEDGDYGSGVLLDTDVFDGVSPRNWGKVLGDYVYKNMAGLELTMYDEDGNAEKVYLARENDRVKKEGAKNSHKVIDKLARYNGDNIRALATVHLSEVLAVSGNQTSSNEHSHQWMDENGWIYRTAYLQDRTGKIYEVSLNIANGRYKRTLYYINNIRQIDTKKETTDGVVSSTDFGRDSHINSDFKMSITDSEAPVNQKSNSVIECLLSYNRSETEAIEKSD